MNQALTVTLTLLCLMVFSMTATTALQFSPTSASRRSFVKNTVGLSFGAGLMPFFASPQVATAAPEILTTEKGLKYSFLKGGKGSPPQVGDVVAIDYTGYKTDGSIFDATHSEGKKNNLTFKLGDRAVIAGLEDIVQQMTVGSKVQVIIPPEMAYGSKGVCLESGECLIKGGETLVYDVFLKKAAIPPP